MLREFTRQISFLVERIFHLSQILHLIVSETIGYISLEEPVRIQIGSCLCRSSQTKSIDVVAGYNCIDRTDIHLTRMVFGTRFHKVLNQGFQAEENVFESLDIRQLIHETAHVAFRLCQFCCPITAPELVVTHHRIRILDFLSLFLENTFLRFQEAIIRVVGRTTHHEMTAEEIQFTKHIILCLYPLSGRQGTELLVNDHIFHKVHVSFLR